jgi:subtilisin family serine protease
MTMHAEARDLDAKRARGVFALRSVARRAAVSLVTVGLLTGAGVSVAVAEAGTIVPTPLAANQTAPLEVDAARTAGDSLVIERYAVANQSDGRAVVAALNAQPGVRAASLNTARYQAFGDPLRSQQWALDVVNFERARNTTSAVGQVVAVVDTGVDAGHPDLAGVVLPGANCVTGSCVSTAADNGATDVFGHGTMVSSLIAANTNNGIGIAGAAPGARILPVRVLDNHGSGDPGAIAAGVVWAVGHGATVINMSLGGCVSDPVLASAVQYALDNNVPVVAAAGNYGDGLAPFFCNPNFNGSYTGPIYPAAIPGVLAVGAVQRNLQLAPYSDTGSWVSLAAPGGAEDCSNDSCIYGATKDGSYGAEAGTSFASPYAAAEVALIRAANPDLTPASVAVVADRTAIDLGPVGKDNAYGYGLLNPTAAVQAALVARSATIDGAGGSFGAFAPTTDAITGRTAAVVDAGIPMEFSYDASRGDLRWGFAAFGRWFFQTIDGEGGARGAVNRNVGMNPVAFMDGGVLEVMFFDASNKSLRLGMYLPSYGGWYFINIDGPFGTASPHGNVLTSNMQPSEVAYGGVPNVFYQRGGSHDLIHVWRVGSTWRTEIVDGAGGANGRTTDSVGDESTAATDGVHLWVFYDDVTSGAIRIASTTGASWSMQTIDGPGGVASGATADTVTSPSAVLLFAGPQVAYFDATAHTLRLAAMNGASWSTQVLDASDSTGANPVLVNTNQRLQIYYGDLSTNDLKRALWTGTTWIFDTLDGDGALPGATTHAVGTGISYVFASGHPNVFYIDSTSNDLRTAVMR